MKWLRLLLIFLVLAFGFIVYTNYPKLNILNGYAAKYTASSIPLAGHSEGLIKAQDLKMPLVELASVTYDATQKSAIADLYGLLKRKAVFSEGTGGLLLPPDTEMPVERIKPNRTFKKIDLPYPYGHLPPVDTLLNTVDYDKLEKAIAFAFSKPETQKTRTVTILYKGFLIGEKYEEGFDGNTRVLGWSMTKSILASCFGLLQHQRGLDLNMKAPIAEWQQDERKMITLNHLLRMQSGLAWDENYDEISDVTKMLFLEKNMTQSQITKNSIAAPTEIWNYSSGTSNLLSGVLRSQFLNHQDYLDFPYASFLDKIGAHSFLIETDYSNHFIGSSYGWASSYDWARVGQFYLDGGFWNGEQYFNKDWIPYITEPTKNSNNSYGAHFWLNAGEQYSDVPTDLYSMNGFQGQYVMIIPSKELVILRTGLAEQPEFDLTRFLQLVCEAIP